MRWHWLLVGIGLVLVFEGIMPFLSPRHYRQFIVKLISQNDKQLRTMGAFSIVLGLIVLIFMKQFFNL